jgi:Ca2+-binding RTX toxin-like protein
MTTPSPRAQGGRGAWLSCWGTLWPSPERTSGCILSGRQSGDPHLPKGICMRLCTSPVRPVLSTAAALALGGAFLLPLSTAQAAAPTCFGQTVTIMGTAGDDNIYASEAVSDVIYGGGGNDVIIGGEFYESGTAPDLLCGGPGNDWIKGARGNDKLNGGDGDDRVNGSNGADIVQGNAGNDTVGEGSFADADGKNDTVRGGSGNDVLMAGWGQDKLYGDDGADTLTDNECDGPTVLNGGAGNDYLESWSSSFEGWHGNVCADVADQIVGAGGTDTAEVDRLDSVSTVERITRITRPTG